MARRPGRLAEPELEQRNSVTGVWMFLKVGAVLRTAIVQVGTRPSPLGTAAPTFFYAPFRIVFFETHVSCGGNAGRLAISGRAERIAMVEAAAGGDARPPPGLGGRTCIAPNIRMGGRVYARAVSGGGPSVPASRTPAGTGRGRIALADS